VNGKKPQLRELAKRAREEKESASRFEIEKS